MRCSEHPGRVAVTVFVTTLTVTALLGVTGPVAVAGGTDAVGPGNVTIQSDDEAFAVVQNGQCHEVMPMGDGSRTVEEFYDYRPNFSYSSAGTRDVQENAVSNLFFYDGANGDSLVFVHDEYDESGGGAVSFTVTGLPGDGDWAVEDDDYAGRDDEFDHSGSRSDIDWIWQDGRTDGAAFRGVGDADRDGITIEPSFDEDASLWGEWSSGDDRAEIDSWRVLSGGGWPVTQLTLDDPVTVLAGGCDTTPPTVSLAVSPTDAIVGQPVTLTADASDDTGVVEYRWDVDGDGRVDRNTSTPTLTTTFDTAGEYEPWLVVRDRAGNTETATATLSVDERGSVATAGDAAASSLRSTLARVPDSRCDLWLQEPLETCWSDAG